MVFGLISRDEKRQFKFRYPYMISQSRLKSSMADMQVGDIDFLKFQDSQRQPAMFCQ
jgi:hypothetical protein